MDRELLHEEITDAIIGAGMTVLNVLRPGLDEKLYDRGMAIELVKQGRSLEQQRQFSVYYDDQRIGVLIPDLIVDEQVIVENKVVSAFNDSHVAQMLGYLSITGLRVGMLLNFKNARLEWKRVVR